MCFNTVMMCVFSCGDLFVRPLLLLSQVNKALCSLSSEQLVILRQLYRCHRLATPRSQCTFNYDCLISKTMACSLFLVTVAECECLPTCPWYTSAYKRGSVTYFKREDVAGLCYLKHNTTDPTQLANRGRESDARAKRRKKVENWIRESVLNPPQVGIVNNTRAARRYILNGSGGATRTKRFIKSMQSVFEEYTVKMGTLEEAFGTRGHQCATRDIISYVERRDEAILLSSFERVVRTQLLHKVVQEEFQCPLVRSAVGQVPFMKRYVYDGHGCDETKLKQEVQRFAGHTETVIQCLLRHRDVFMRYCTMRHGNGRLVHYAMLVSHGVRRYDDIQSDYLKTLQRTEKIQDAEKHCLWACGNCDISKASLSAIRKHTLCDHAGLQLRVTRQRKR